MIDGAPAVADLNMPLLKTKINKTFPYILSLWVSFENSNKDELPSELAKQSAEVFEAVMGEQLKGSESLPNIMFLASLTSDNARDLFYRVRKPKLVRTCLQALASQKDYPIKFDYVIDKDAKGEAEEWLLKVLDS